MTNYKEEALAMKDEIVANRRKIHGFAELGFDLDETVELVMNELRSYGYEPQKCGRAGVTAVAGKGGKVVILRGDMDALPMREESGLDFASKKDSCHSCGHDLHTAMLLGAAKLLKTHESELQGRVKFMFQPAEELLGGAVDMIQNGLLENPHVDAAIGMHTFAGDRRYSKVGAVSYKKEYVTFSGDYIKINVVGKPAHGSQPNMGVDAINIAAHIVIALQEILAREINSLDHGVVLVGKIAGGSSCNTQSGDCQLDVSVRADTAPLRDFLKNRVKEIAESTAKTFRGEAKVEFVYGQPPMYNNPEMCDCVVKYCEELLGKENVIEKTEHGGTEDFTAVSELVPSMYINIGAGCIAGEDVTAHSANIIFDEDVLPVGAAVYAYTAARYLEEHK